MLTGEQKYYDHILEYIGAWAERTEANGGVVSLPLLWVSLISHCICSACHWRLTAFALPAIDVSLPLDCLSLTSHCLSTAFH